MRRKFRLKESDVSEIAERFNSERSLSHVRYRYRLLGVRKDKIMPPKQWVAVFEARTMDGDIIDSGPIVLVDDESGVARYFE